MKVIHISKRGYAHWKNNNLPLELDNPIFLEDGWNFTMVKYLTHSSTNIQFECWRVDEEVRETTILRSRGIKVKLIPDSKNDFFQLALIKELVDERRKNKFILHIHDAHDIQTYALVNLFHNFFPIIVQHRGNWHRMIESKGRLGFKKYFLKKLETRFLKKVSKFYTCSRYWLLLTHRYNKNIVLQSGGKDFSQFKVLNKNQCREELSIPEDKIVILYVGKYIKLKGLDLLIASFNALKNKYPLYLLVVGGSNKDELYPLVKNLQKGESQFINFLHYDKIPLVVNSSDIYANYLRGFDRFFAGISSSAVEALACDKPVLSRNLVHFDGDYKKLGFIPTSEEDFFTKLEKLIINRQKYNNLRGIVEPHYSWPYQTKIIIRDYNKLYSDFFH